MTNAPLADLRLQRASERLAQLPARVLYELLREIAVAHDIVPDVVERATLYGALDLDLLCCVGGDRFPPSLRVAA